MLRRKLLYLFLVFLLALFAILYNTYTMAVLFLLVGLLPVLLFVIALIVTRKIHIEVQCNESIVKKGDNIEVIVYLKNPTIFPVPRIAITTKYRHLYEIREKKETFHISVDTLGEQRLIIHFVTNYCGNVLFQVPFIRVYDCLGIFSFQRKIKVGITISVLPNIKVLEEELVLTNSNVLTESNTFSAIKSGDDPSELFSIHEYKAGDRINHIHWKLSLKKDELMVKEFGLPIDSAIIIMVELLSFNGSNKEVDIISIDAVIEAVFTMSYSLITQSREHYIAWLDSKEGYCKRIKIEQEGDLYEVFSFLFLSEIYDIDKSIIQYHTAEFEKEQYSNIFYVTPYINEMVLRQLEETKKNAICHVVAANKENSLNDQVLDMWKDYLGTPITSVWEWII